MPRRKQKNKVLEKSGNVSMEPILQDFSITSQSDMKIDVLPPSDSSLFENIISFETALPNVTLNQTDDVNVSSELYPPDTTIDITKLNPLKPLFKKPFNIRSRRKPRPSIFDKDVQDSENDTPEPKICRPFQRKNKVGIPSNLFDDVFDSSSNESIMHSTKKENFITRRKLRGKKNVDRSLFDNDLNSSESVDSFSERRVLPTRKINLKKLNANEFDHVFDDTLNGSVIDNPVLKKIPFKTLKNKKSNVESSLFDRDLDSSNSLIVSSMLENCDNDKYKPVNTTNDKNSTNQDSDDTLSNSINKAAPKKMPFYTQMNKVTTVETSLFDHDLKSSDSLNVSSMIETQECGSKTIENENLNDTDKESSNICQSQKLPFKSLLSKNKNIDSNLFDSNFNSSYSLQLSSSVISCGEKEKASNTIESEEKQHNIINSMLEGKTCGSFKGSENESINVSECNKSKYDNEDELSHLSIDVEKNQNINVNSSLHSRSGKVSKDNTIDKLFHSVLEVGVNKQNERKTLSGSNCNTNLLVKTGNGNKESLSSALALKNTSIEDPNNKECDEHLEVAVKISNSSRLSFGNAPVEVPNDTEYCDHLEEAVKDIHSSKLSLENGSVEVPHDEECCEHLEDAVKDIHSSRLSLENRSIEVLHDEECGEYLEDAVKDIHSSRLSLESASVDFLNNVECGKHLVDALKNTSVNNSALLSKSECINLTNRESVDYIEANKLNIQEHLMEECVSEKGKSCCVQRDLQEDPEDKNILSSINLLLPTENRKEMRSPSIIPMIELNNLSDVEIQICPLQNNRFLNTSENILEIPNRQSLLMQHDYVTNEILTSSFRKPSPSPEKAKEAKYVLNNSIENLTLPNGNLSKYNTISSHITRKSASISYEAADSSNPITKKRRVSFLCDVESVNKSMQRRRSVRKSEHRNSTERQSTSRLNRSQLSKSGFSLHIEQSSNSITSDSVYIDIHPSRNKSTSSSSNAERNSSYSNQSTRSIGARESNKSSNSKSIRLDSGNSSINESQQTKEDKEETLSEMVVEEMNGEYSTNHDLTESDSKIDNEVETVEENQETSANWTDEEVKDDHTHEEICEENESMLDDEESEDKTGLSSGEKGNSNNKRENCSDFINMEQQCKSLFKVPKLTKRVTKKCSASKKPLPQPLNKTRVQEILDNIPYSEFKVRTRKGKDASKPIKQKLLYKNPEKEIKSNTPYKKEKRKRNANIVSKKILKPAKWITPNFYLFLTKKLKPRFGIKSRIQAENIVTMLVDYVNCILSKQDNFYEIVEEMKCDLAKFSVIQTHLDFHDLIRDYFDGDFRDKLFPFNDNDYNPFEPGDLLESIL